MLSSQVLCLTPTLWVFLADACLRCVSLLDADYT